MIAEPVEHNGRKVIPGEIHDFVNKKPYPLVDESAEHYTILNDGKPSRMLKAHENKFYKVNAKHKVLGDPSSAINEAQLHGPVSKKQRDLIVGTDIQNGIRTPINSGIHAKYPNAPYFMDNAKGKKIFIKPGNPEADLAVLGDDEFKTGFSQPQREAAFHNAMHDVFKLGEHMPTTVAFRAPGSSDLHTAMEFREGRHLNKKDFVDNSQLNGLHASGITPKLAVADWILGNRDRHLGNFIYSQNPSQIHLIDHGGAFDYKGLEHIIPSYVRPKHYSQDFDPEVKKWIMGLDHKKLEQVLTASGAPPEHVKTASDRLDRIQSGIHYGEKISPEWMRHPQYRVTK